NKPGASPDHAPDAPVAFSSDMDEMLYMYSLGVFVQGKRIDPPNDTDWIKAMERLRSSGDPAVAAAAAASGPAAIPRAARREINTKLSAENRAIQEELTADNKALEVELAKAIEKKHAAESKAR